MLSTSLIGKPKPNASAVRLLQSRRQRLVDERVKLSPKPASIPASTITEPVTTTYRRRSLSPSPSKSPSTDRPDPSCRLRSRSRSPHASPIRRSMPIKPVRSVDRRTGSFYLRSSRLLRFQPATVAVESSDVAKSPTDRLSTDEKSTIDDEPTTENRLLPTWRSPDPPTFQTPPSVVKSTTTTGIDDQKMADLFASLRAVVASRPRNVHSMPAVDLCHLIADSSRRSCSIDDLRNLIGGCPSLRIAYRSDAADIEIIWPENRRLLSFQSTGSSAAIDGIPFKSTARTIDQLTSSYPEPPVNTAEIDRIRSAIETELPFLPDDLKNQLAQTEERDNAYRRRSITEDDERRIRSDIQLIDGLQSVVDKTVAGTDKITVGRLFDGRFVICRTASEFVDRLRRFGDRFPKTIDLRFDDDGLLFVQLPMQLNDTRQQLVDRLPAASASASAKICSKK